MGFVNAGSVLFSDLANNKKVAAIGLLPTKLTLNYREKYFASQLHHSFSILFIASQAPHKCSAGTNEE